MLDRKNLSSLWSSLWQWRLFIIAGVAASLGVGFTVGGAVLVILTALAGGMFAVLASALLFGLGVVLTIGVYLWLTLG